MLNGYKLGESKLSKELFSDKYWMGGQEEYIYQFHTMDIEDGKNERQQLLINNDRALYKMIREVLKNGGLINRSKEIHEIKKELKGMKKITGLLITLQFLEIVIITLRLILFLSKKKQ